VTIIYTLSQPRQQIQSAKSEIEDTKSDKKRMKLSNFGLFWGLLGYVLG